MATEQDQGQGGIGTTNADSAADVAARKVEAQPNSNVRLAHNKQPITVDGVINIGNHTVTVPDEAQQRAGFNLKNAHLLIQQYPGVYLAIVDRYMGLSHSSTQQEGQQDAKA